MPASTLSTADELHGVRSSDSTDPAGRVGWPAVTPEFYRNNPFRQTGLRILAGPREILKRIDQLKLSAELGALPSTWAFAPAEPLPLDEIRAASQILQNPPERLLHEFFWFWPENYPQDTPDNILDILGGGDIGRAGELWRAAAAEGQEIAWHNLAVYHHLLALDWENDPGRDDDTLGQIWRHALNYWLQIAVSESIWTRLQARVAALGDAQLTPESVARLRAGFLDTIAQINAGLACQHAERGRTSRAALHVSLVAQIFPGAPARSASLLEHAALPAARRLAARGEKAAHDSMAAVGAGLAAATALVHESGHDLRVLATLGGASSEFFHEHVRLFASTVLDGVVRYQRETADDRNCLPLLRYLLDLSVPRELARRIDDAHTVIQANALGKKTAGSPGVPPAIANEDELATHLEVFRLIVDTLIPGLDRLGLMDTARQAYAARLAAWLKTLAVDVCRQEDELEWPMSVMAVALALPCDLPTLSALATTRNQIERDFHIRRKKAVRLEIAGHTLLINVHGIALDNQWVTTDALTGLREGRISPEGKGPPRYLVAWRSAEAEFKIDETTLFSQPATAVDDYARVIDAIYYFMVPPLIKRLTDSLRDGQSMVVGHLQLDRANLTIAPVGTRFFKRDIVIPYALTTHRVQNYQLVISSLENPKLIEMVDTMQTWNAAIAGAVIDQLKKA